MMPVFGNEFENYNPNAASAEIHAVLIDRIGRLHLVIVHLLEKNEQLRQHIAAAENSKQTTQALAQES